MDDVLGANGGMVPLGPEHPPFTHAGPYVGAFVGAFKVDPMLLVSSGFGAVVEEVSGVVFVAAAPEDPDGPTSVISRPIVRAPFPVNMLFPFGCVVFKKLYATTLPFVDEVTLVI